MLPRPKWAATESGRRTFATRPQWVCRPSSAASCASSYWASRPWWAGTHRAASTGPYRRRDRASAGARPPASPCSQRRRYRHRRRRIDLAVAGAPLHKCQATETSHGDPGDPPYTRCRLERDNHTRKAMHYSATDDASPLSPPPLYSCQVPMSKSQATGCKRAQWKVLGNV